MTLKPKHRIFDNVGMAWIALLLIGLVPVDIAAVDRVSVTEKNHYYCEQGKLNFSQFIFWNWNEEKSRHEVVAWRFVKGPSSRLTINGQHVLIWIDNGRLRKVTSGSKRESWTQHDEEIFQRTILPPCERRELSK